MELGVGDRGCSSPLYDSKICPNRIPSIFYLNRIEVGQEPPCRQKPSELAVGNIAIVKWAKFLEVGAGGRGCSLSFHDCMVFHDKDFDARRHFLEVRVGHRGCSSLVLRLQDKPHTISSVLLVDNSWAGYRRSR